MATSMTKPFLSDNIQNLAGTRTVPPPKQPWLTVFKELFNFGEMVAIALPAIPTLIVFYLFGAGLLFYILLIPTLLMLDAALRRHRQAARHEIKRYHKARENTPLTLPELQALNLCARFTYRNQGWYHTYENYPFWDRKAMYDDPAFSESDPYLQQNFDYSEHMAQSLKRDWSITSKPGTLSTVTSLRDGQMHRCEIISLINREGFDTVYGLLTPLSHAAPDSFHPLFFPEDEDDPNMGQSLSAALSQLGVDKAEFLAHIHDKCHELDDPEQLHLHGDARDQIFQMVRHIGRLSLRNDLRNIFLFDAETVDKVLYPQGELDLLPLGWGFDLSRGMFLLRRAYAAGFVTRDELIAQLPGYRQIASAVFSDWQSYFCSEVIGFLSWKLRDAEPAEAFKAAGIVADETRSALRQEFPIGNQLPWPDPDTEAQNRLAACFSETEANPFFLPQTLGVRVSQPRLEELEQPKNAVLH